MQENSHGDAELLSFLRLRQINTMSARESLFKFFSSFSGNHYVYDARCNRIIPLDPAAASRPGFSIEVECRLGATFPYPFFSDVKWEKSFAEFADKMDGSVSRLILQLTTSCNLACTYCVYSGNYAHMDAHSFKDMPHATILKALQYFRQKNRRCQDARIDFYGGEPLLRFQEIMQIHPYIRELFADKNLKITLTTNGLLLRGEVCQWLARSPEVTVFVTCNGPFQDDARVRRDGSGSLEELLDNLRTLREHYPDVWARQIRFIANVTGEDKIPALLTFYQEELGTLPSSVTGIRPLDGNDIIRDMIDYDSRDDSCRRHFAATGDPALGAVYGNAVYAIHNRRLGTPATAAVIGSCFPLTERLYVLPDGRFGICESASEHLTLGNVDTGPDWDRLRALYAKVHRLCFRQCSGCWAQRLCTLCLKEFVGPDGSVRTEIPPESCRDSRRHTLDSLRTYCTMIENGITPTSPL